LDFLKSANRGTIEPDSFAEEIVVDPGSVIEKCCHSPRQVGEFEIDDLDLVPVRSAQRHPSRSRGRSMR